MQSLQKLGWKLKNRLYLTFQEKPSYERALDERVKVEWSPLASERSGTVRKLRILYAAPKFDYGDPNRGYSFEENNFFHALYTAGHEIIRFDFPTIFKAHGREHLNAMLSETVYRYTPDVMFTVLFKDEFDCETIRAISELPGSPLTFNWFTDDHWRFENFTRQWAPCFNWSVTTDAAALVKYEAAGIPNVALSQWGCNHHLYYKMDIPKLYDVSFVGLPHGNRRAVIDQIRAAGLSVHVWGYGWEGGKVSQREMVRIFNQSRICLNLSNASTGRADQIKGRNFELPACGAFTLTGDVDSLERYYAPGQEVITYTHVDDLIDKARYYLAHETEREFIAEQGFARTIRDHTYERRFTDLFRQFGLDTPTTHDSLPQCKD